MWTNPNKNFWEKRRVLVTGATGFVGSWLVNELISLGASIIALVPGSELYPSAYVNKADIKIEDGVLERFNTLHYIFWKHSPQTVFHLGAQTQVKEAYNNPLATLETNIRGTYNILEVCRRYPRIVEQIIVASSDKAYGVSSSSGLPYKEDHKLIGSYPYDVSKSCADLIAQGYAKTYDLPIGITRCGNIYGGGDMNWDRIVPGTIRSLYQGKSPVIRSDGKFVRDYIHIEDTVAAYLCLAEKLASDSSYWGQAFNFSGRSPVSVLDLVEKIQ
ncbi:MAG TPA: NAD-dependent epimerase/dehydratase family protein, partial [Methylomirabilota bacterium]|nr:NAD-dependent epimerase/dehydratase family protein [Methylomirabilota bacterium]